jgi:hypothetical protein
MDSLRKLLAKTLSNDLKNSDDEDSDDISLSSAIASYDKSHPFRESLLTKEGPSVLLKKIKDKIESTQPLIDKLICLSDRTPVYMKANAFYMLEQLKKRSEEFSNIIDYFKMYSALPCADHSILDECHEFITEFEKELRKSDEKLTKKAKEGQLEHLLIPHDNLENALKPFITAIESITAAGKALIAETIITGPATYANPSLRKRR